MRRLLYPILWFLVPSLVMLGCGTPPSPLPHHIELLHRYPLHTIQVDGHQIAYLDNGLGRPVILLHGFGGSMWHWEHQQPVLSQAHRVLTLDMLGSGLSAKPPVPYSPDLLLHVVDQFMNNLGISQATLIGNSLGAGVAIGMALSYPERVDKLVLISGFPANVLENLSSPTYRRFVEHRPPLWLAKAGLWLMGRWATERTLKEIIFDQTRITPLLIERSYRNRADPEFLHPLYSLLDHLDQWEQKVAARFGEIQQPTLILWGTNDRVFPPPVGKALREAIPHAVFQEVPHSGHIPQWENPEKVNTALIHFLQN